LEIVVLDRRSDKLIRMEVQPKHTIGSIIETIVDKQKMDKSQKYRLSLGDRSFGKEQYLLKVRDAGISHGDHLFLEAEHLTACAPVVEPRRTSWKDWLNQPVAWPSKIGPKPSAVGAPTRSWKEWLNQPVGAKKVAEITQREKPPASAAATKFCLYCGAKIPRVSKFCQECGGKLT